MSWPTAQQWQTIAGCLVLAAIVIAADLALYWWRGNDATISESWRAFGNAVPLVPFLVLGIAGHIFGLHNFFVGMAGYLSFGTLWGQNRDAVWRAILTFRKPPAP